MPNEQEQQKHLFDPSRRDELTRRLNAAILSNKDLPKIFREVDPAEKRSGDPGLFEQYAVDTARNAFLRAKLAEKAGDGLAFIQLMNQGANELLSTAGYFAMRNDPSYTYNPDDPFAVADARREGSQRLLRIIQSSHRPPYLVGIGE